MAKRIGILMCGSHDEHTSDGRSRFSGVGVTLFPRAHSHTHTGMDLLLNLRGNIYTPQFHTN